MDIQSNAQIWMYSAKSDYQKILESIIILLNYLTSSDGWRTIFLYMILFPEIQVYRDVSMNSLMSFKG